MGGIRNGLPATNHETEESEMDCPGKVRKDTARFTPVRNSKWTASPASTKARGNPKWTARHEPRDRGIRDGLPRQGSKRYGAIYASEESEMDCPTGKQKAKGIRNGLPRARTGTKQKTNKNPKWTALNIATLDESTMFR